MLMEELKRRDSETEEEYENRIAEYRREMKEQEEEEESQPLPKPPRPVIEERKRSFSDRQRRLEEKKLQQQKEEAERTRIEEEKRMKKDAKRRERKERERRESTQGQTLEEQDKNDYVSYYGPNFSVHPALTNSNPFSDNNDDKVVSKPPPPVIRQEYDAFSEGMTPERIIGATDELGELSFLVKWKGTDEADFVPAKKAKLHCPELVIRFYEGIIAWK